MRGTFEAARRGATSALPRINSFEGGATWGTEEENRGHSGLELAKPRPFQLRVPNLASKAAFYRARVQDM